MSRTPPSLSASALAACSLCAAARLFAQSPAEQPRVVLPPVEAQVVYVDVSVTDKQGRPVDGLQPADFDVLEDGQRMEIVNFTAGPVGAPPDASGATVSVPDAPPAPARAPAALPEDRRLNLVVYVDNATLHPVNRKRVFDRLRGEFLVNLPAEYRVMVVSHDNGFRIRQPFTEDLEQVRETLRQMEKDHGGGVQREAERRQLARLIEQQGGFAVGGGAEPGLLSMLLGQVENLAEREAQDVRASLGELARFVELMGALPGRKSLVYVSDGLSGRPGEALLQALTNGLGGGGERALAELPGGALISESVARDVRSGFTKLIQRANANRVTFYAVDGSSAQAGFGVSAEEASSGGLGDRRVWDSSVEAAFRLDRVSTLAHMAEATGGVRLAANSKLGQRLKELAQDMTRAYALAYVPPHAGDGKYHKIEVEVRGAGLGVHHREGYFDKTADERAADAAYAALVTDADNPLGVALEAGSPKPDGKGGFLVPLVVKLPLARLRLQREGDADVGRLTLFFVVQDVKGGMSDVQKRELPIRLPAAKVKAGEKQVMGYPVPLTMRRGEYTVAVAVRDELGGQRAAASLRVRL